MKFNRRILNESFIIFILLAVFYAVGNFIWWIINTPILPICYSALHFNDIFKPDFLFYNAPLVTYIMKFMFFVFGKEYYDLIIIFVNYIFFLIPLYFIYKIGVEFKDKETGNIAMILFALVPAVYGLSRQYGHQDYHIIAGITFNIYCLIKTDYFNNKKWVVWYGISVGLGLIIKDAFLLYFFMPFIYISILGFVKNRDRIKTIINILIAVTGASLISGWHYFRPEIIRKVLNEPIVETVPVFSFNSLRFTTTGLWEYLLSFPIFLVAIIGLLYFIWKYKGKYKNVILLWFFIPWGIITFMPHIKMPEYGVGFIPAMILMGSVFISSAVNGRIKKLIIIILFIIIGVLQYIDFSFNKLNISLFKLELKWQGYTTSYYNTNNSLITLDYNVQKVIIKTVKYLESNYSNKKCKIYIADYIDTYGLLAYVNIKNVDCTWPDKEGYGNRDVLKSDIIILFGNQKTKTIEQLIESQISRMEEYPWARVKDKQNFIKEETKRIKCIYNDIEKYYRIIDVFYISSPANAELKMTLFGRKDQFSDTKIQINLNK